MAAKRKNFGPIYSIDEVTLDIAKYHIEKNGLSDWVHLLEGSSGEVFKKWPDLVENPEIGFLLIDGDHSFQGVVDDMNCWIPYLKKGGYVVFHDVHSMRFPQISKPIYDRIVTNPGFGNFLQIESPPRRPI